MTEKLKYAVFGNGSWATAIVKILCESLDKVNWYVRNPKSVNYILEERHNPGYLSSVELDTSKLNLNTDISFIAEESDVLIFAIPSAFINSQLNKLSVDISAKIIVSAVKGIVPESGLLLGEYFHKKKSVPFDKIAIIGQSGIGKSVLLKCIIGLLAPDNGSIIIDDQDINKISFKKLQKLRSKFGMVFQFGALFDSMTVGENIGLALQKLTNCDRFEINERISNSLLEVNMENTQDKMPSELSGGMKKRVGIARAIALNPEYMLYDEPTTGLDPIMTDSINRLINNFHSNGNVTSVVVTHEMKTVRDASERVIMLYNGKIQFDGTTDTFLKSFGLNRLSDLPKLKEISEIIEDEPELIEQIDAFK